MSLDITPTVPEGRPLIQGYGDLRFRIANTRHDGGVLITPAGVLAWNVTHPQGVTAEVLAPVADMADTLDILIVGCGAAFTDPPAALRDHLRGMGVVLEWMDTGAACRTFNVLLSEERRVAAALIAVA